MAFTAGNSVSRAASNISDRRYQTMRDFQNSVQQGLGEYQRKEAERQMQTAKVQALADNGLVDPKFLEQFSDMPSPKRAAELSRIETDLMLKQQANQQAAAQQKALLDRQKSVLEMESQKLENKLKGFGYQQKADQAQGEARFGALLNSPEDFGGGREAAIDYGRSAGLDVQELLEKYGAGAGGAVDERQLEQTASLVASYGGGNISMNPDGTAKITNINVRQKLPDGAVQFDPQSTEGKIVEDARRLAEAGREQDAQLLLGKLDKQNRSVPNVKFVDAEVGVNALGEKIFRKVPMQVIERDDGSVDMVPLNTDVKGSGGAASVNKESGQSLDVEDIDFDFSGGSFYGIR